MPLLGGYWPRQTHFAEAAKCKGKRFRTSPLGLHPMQNYSEWRPTRDQISRSLYLEYPGPGCWRRHGFQLRTSSSGPFLLDRIGLPNSLKSVSQMLLNWPCRQSTMALCSSAKLRTRLRTSAFHWKPWPQTSANMIANMINHIRSTMSFATLPPIPRTFPADPSPATLTLLHVIIVLLIGVLRLVGPDTSNPRKKAVPKECHDVLP